MSIESPEPRTVTARPLRLGTRASVLALWQTEQVRARLAERGHATGRVDIRTTGDVIQDVPLSRVGGRAIFTKQLDDALLDGRIDLAVHSLKDLPTTLPEGIALAAVGLRDDPRDALVARGGHTWTTLPRGGTVATSSVRRRAQLLRARPDLRVVDIRGNVDTRLTKLDRNQDWVAVLLAAAGLVRLGLASRISERLPLDVMLPAPGQGALAVTVRAGDRDTASAARAALHDPDTALAVAAERAFLRRLEGGCQVPVAALAEVTREGAGAAVRLRGRVVSLSGDASVEGDRSGAAATPAEAEALGAALAEALLGRGADAILRSVRATTAATVSEP